MAPSLDTAGRNIVIAAGNAVIKGQLWRTDASVSTPIPAPSASDRLDRLALRYNRSATTSATVVQPTVITGTPGGGLPPYQQTPTGLWDLPVCHWTSHSSGALDTLIDERKLANDRWHDMRSEFGGLINGFSFSGAPEMPPQFRIRDDGTMVEVIGAVSLPGGAAPYNNTNFFQFPMGYISPQAASWPVTFTGTWTQPYQNYIGNPRTYIASGGQLQLVGIPYQLNGTVVRIYGAFPVGLANGLKTQ